MYKKMLVLLDGSNLAEVVFTYAQELSGRLCLDLELLHVCSPQEAEQLPMRRAYLEHMSEILKANAEKIRSDSGCKPDEKDIQAKGTVVVGYPAEEILKYVDENDIDIVMLSTHGRSGVKAWDLGAVASKVIHGSNVPIWLVPTELREDVIHDKVPRRTIVIPLSGNKPAEVVIPHAIAIAKQRGAESEIALVYVFDPVTTSVNMEQIRNIEEQQAMMKKFLDEQVQNIIAQGIPARGEILMGDPPQAIIDYVKDHPTQLIAMATRGRTGLSRMIFGSVTENVIHLVKRTPIFLVPSN